MQQICSLLPTGSTAGVLTQLDASDQKYVLQSTFITIYDVTPGAYRIKSFSQGSYTAGAAKSESMLAPALQAAVAEAGMPHHLTITCDLAEDAMGVTVLLHVRVSQV